MSLQKTGRPPIIIPAAADLYLQYAAQALCWSYQATTEEKKRAFLELSHIWARAAIHPEARW